MEEVHLQLAASEAEMEAMAAKVAEAEAHNEAELAQPLGTAGARYDQLQAASSAEKARLTADATPSEELIIELDAVRTDLSGGQQANRGYGCSR